VHILILMMNYFVTFLVIATVICVSMNYCWISSSASFIVVHLVFLLHDLYRVGSDITLLLFSQILVVVTMVVSCWKLEQYRKHSFLHMHHMQRISEELKVIFQELPEGAIVLEKEKHKIILVNQEFKQLLRSDHYCDKFLQHKLFRALISSSMQGPREARLLSL